MLMGVVFLTGEILSLRGQEECFNLLYHLFDFVEKQY